jgi:hypothetical protein
MSRCEAMILVKGFNREGREGMYVMCGREPADLHHKLTRARGGLILDEAGEDYHLMRLCREHHDMAHDEGTAYDAGLLLRGYVNTDPVFGWPVYTGPDEYLQKKYGQQVST